MQRDEANEIYINRYYKDEGRTMAVARDLKEADRLIRAYYATEDGAQYFAEMKHFQSEIQIIGARTARPEMKENKRLEDK